MSQVTHFPVAARDLGPIHGSTNWVLYIVERPDSDHISLHLPRAKAEVVFAALNSAATTKRAMLVDLLTDGMDENRAAIIRAAVDAEAAALAADFDEWALAAETIAERGTAEQTACETALFARPDTLADRAYHPSEAME